MVALTHRVVTMLGTFHLLTLIFITKYRVGIIVSISQGRNIGQDNSGTMTCPRNTGSDVEFEPIRNPSCSQTLDHG